MLPPSSEFSSVQQFEIGELKNFIYLILDHSTHKAAIVDPQKDIRLPIHYLGEHGFELESILLTHTHHDHIAGVPVLLKTYPKLTIYVHEKDLRRLDAGYSGIKKISDQDKIRVGNLSVLVMHTPGHSAGECSYYFEAEKKYLFTGDTLFIRDCGRTDLDTGNDREMFASLQRIKALPEDTVIFPGHHYQAEYFSTLKDELRDSPPLRCRSVEELASLP